MNKKDTIPNILKEKINNEAILKKIIEEKKSNSLKKFGEWLLLPISVCLFLFFSLKIESNYKNSKNTNQFFKLQENNGQNSGENNYSNSQKDSSYEAIETKEELKLPFKVEKIPIDLIKTKNQNLYVLEKDKKKLVGYRKTFTSKDESRQITFVIMKKEENLNQILEERKYKKTQENEIIMIEFNYKNKYVQMKTINITEEEIESFLKSI